MADGPEPTIQGEFTLYRAYRARKARENGPQDNRYGIQVRTQHEAFEARVRGKLHTLADFGQGL